MSDELCDHDLLLQSNERLVALSKRVEEFIATIKENNAETKRQHQEEINKLRIDVNELKTNVSQARGALWLLYFLCTTGGIIISIIIKWIVQ